MNNIVDEAYRIKQAQPIARMLQVRLGHTIAAKAVSPTSLRYMARQLAEVRAIERGDAIVTSGGRRVF